MQHAVALTSDILYVVSSHHWWGTLLIQSHRIQNSIDFAKVQNIKLAPDETMVFQLSFDVSVYLHSHN